MRNRKKQVSVIAGIMAAILLLSMILSIIPHASAASSSEIKNQINQLKEKRSELQKKKQALKDQIRENDDEIAKIVTQKNIIDQEMGILYAEIVNINDQISTYNLLIADKQDELDAAIARHAALNEQNKERVRTMEEEGTVSYWSVLFKANSFSDLLDRLNMIDEINASDQRRLKELNEAAEEVAVAQQELLSEKDALEVTRMELASAEVELEEKRAEADQLITKLLEKGAEAEALLHEAEDAESDVSAQIGQKQKEYEDAKASEEEAYWAAYWATYVPPTTAPPETTKETTSSDGASSNEGDNKKPVSNASWIVPCSYRILSSPFGNRGSPTAGASSFHQGVDLAGPEGTPIRASRGGTVTSARYSNSGGYMVTISHGDGFASVYMHMTHYIVGAGQTVTQGQVIGYMGSTGISTGSHLHFGITYNGQYVNPALYIPL